MYCYYPKKPRLRLTPRAASSFGLLETAAAPFETRASCVVLSEKRSSVGSDFSGASGASFVAR